MNEYNLSRFSLPQLNAIKKEIKKRNKKVFRNKPGEIRAIDKQIKIASQKPIKTSTSIWDVMTGKPHG